MAKDKRKYKNFKQNRKPLIPEVGNGEYFENEEENYINNGDFKKR